MGFSCGCVGLPNVGKSTLFNVLMKKVIAEASNRAFTTIDPNRGQVPVVNIKLDKIAKIENSKKTVYPTLECVDIAGLVKEASKGKGKGNSFLSNIREVDLVMHVVRCFDDEEVSHVEGGVNPIRDVELIETELQIADRDLLEKMLNKKKNNLEASEKQLITKAMNLIDEGIYLSDADFNHEEQDWLKKKGMITILPKFYVANIDETDLLNGNKYLDELKNRFPNDDIIPVAVKLEESLLNLSDNERDEMYELYNIKNTGLNLVLQTGYKMLDLQTYFTVGPKEAKGWTIMQNTKAPQAAGKIHTDFEKGFICADVVAYDDFMACDGYQKAKLQGKIRQEGRNYILQQNDICNFKYNVDKKK